MLLVGHSHAAIGKAVSHALVHSQCQQELALQLARKETVVLQTKLTEVEIEMQSRRPSLIVYTWYIDRSVAHMAHTHIALCLLSVRVFYSQYSQYSQSFDWYSQYTHSILTVYSHYTHNFKAEKQREIMAITGGFGRDRDLNKQPLDKDEIKNLQKKRDSNIIWMNDRWIYKEIQPYVHQANQNAGWNYDWDWSESCQFTI